MEHPSSTEPDDLFPRLGALLAREQGYRLARITRATRLQADAGTDGDDAVEFLEAYEREFRVDLTSFRYYHHLGPKGCNPFWLFVRPWWLALRTCRSPSATSRPRRVQVAGSTSTRRTRTAAMHRERGTGRLGDNRCRHVREQ